MKKHYYLLGIAASALVIAAPVAALAEDGGSADATVNVSVQTQAPVPLPLHGPLTGDRPEMPPIPANASGTIRDRIRADYQSRLQNAENNEQTRNAMIQERMGIATSTRADIRGIRTEDRPMLRDASSTQQRQDMRNGMRLDIFKVRQNAVVQQLNVSIENLKQIRGRIASRIGKEEQAGKDMTAPKALLVTADAKIAAAELAVNAVVAFDPNASMVADADNAVDSGASASASTTVDLAKPRQALAGAIEAVKEARDALNDVVQSLIKVLGLSPEPSASSTQESGSQ